MVAKNESVKNPTDINSRVRAITTSPATITVEEMTGIVVARDRSASPPVQVVEVVVASSSNRRWTGIIIDMAMLSSTTTINSSIPKITGTVDMRRTCAGQEEEEQFPPMTQ